MTTLAIDGGTPVRRDPFPARGHIGAEEKAAVDALFDRAIVTGEAPGYNGEVENAYCEAFSAFMGGGYTDAVSSGTAGLYVALRALDLEPFGEVVVGAVTDPGGMMPIPLLNLIPIVADTTPDSYNTGLDQVAACFSPCTRAVVIPHIGGEPADVAPIVEAAHARGIPVIEDCAQAHGATIDGRRVGTFGDIGVFSTMFGKHHSTGGQGGLVFTREASRYHAIRRASDRGKPFFLPEGATNAMASLNFNASDLAAAVGRVQLRKLPAVIRRRRAIAASLAGGMASMPSVRVPDPVDGAAPTYWFLRVRFDPDAVRVEKARFCEALRAEGLPVVTDYRAALPHTMRWFEERRVFGTSGYPWSSPAYGGDPDRAFPCPNAQAVMDAHFHIQVHEAWGPQEVADALEILAQVVAALRD
jgi:dTDP-4-amino-4,6-dideoxygalactose transaminase